MGTLYNTLKNKENIIILFYVFFLLIISTLVVNSATQNIADNIFFFTKRHILWILLGFGSLLLGVFINYEKVSNLHWYIYAGTIFLLSSLFIIGTERSGAKSWIVIKGQSFQPSEVAKIMLIFFLAKYLSEKIDEIAKIKEFIFVLIIGLVPIFLVIKQPDMGTAMIMLSILGGMIFISNMHRFHLIIISLGGLISLPLIWSFGLKTYQKKRLLVFINPNLDPLGSGYNVIQSKIAIGSGRLLGKGLLEGTQNNFNYIPRLVKHSDFVFSILGEELGFFGTLVTVLVFFLLISTLFKISLKCKKDLDILLVIGISIMFFVQIIENIGMTIGLLPVTGIPLPFLSFGGTAMLVNMFAIGLILNINKNNSTL